MLGIKSRSAVWEENAQPTVISIAPALSLNLSYFTADNIDCASWDQPIRKFFGLFCFIVIVFV